MPPLAAPGPSGDLLLKVTPPRVPRDLVARQRLLADDARLRDCPVVLVQAPAGFGKTSLLAQWRREHLARGAVVAWLSAQPQDDPTRLVQGLALAVRAGAGRPTFGHTLLECAPPRRPRRHHRLAGRSGADGAGPGADRRRGRPPAGQPRARRWPTCCATRRPTCAPWSRRAPTATSASTTWSPTASARWSAPAALRFTLEETLELVRGAPRRADRQRRRRAPARADRGLAAGPAAGAVGDARRRRSRRPRCSAMAAPAARCASSSSACCSPTSIRPTPRSSPASRSSTTCIPSCAALTRGRRRRRAPGAPRRATRRSSSPASRASGCACTRWRATRCAQRARDCCRPPSRPALHARAAEWLAERGMLEEAARHALAAGQHDRAYELAERSLYESHDGARSPGRGARMAGRSCRPTSSTGVRACCWPRPGRSR